VTGASKWIGTMKAIEISGKRGAGERDPEKAELAED
jgi:hypothetical protein